MSRLRIGWPVGPLMLVVAAAQAVAAVLFFFQAPIATSIWPLPATGEMTMIFLASILAAAAASTAWCVLWGEPASLVGIALDYLAVFGLVLIFMVTLDPAHGGGLSALVVALVSGLLFGTWLLWWSWRHPIRDQRATPRVVLASFWVFVVALILVGGALVMGTRAILPWSVTPELSVVHGAIFLAASLYFAYGIVRPRWSNAGGQLAGFLAYDLVLIVPFLTRFQSNYTGWSLSLVVYTAVLIGSGLIAAYYLFVCPGTRIMRSRTTPSL